jgi:hypothetical protein
MTVETRAGLGATASKCKFWDLECLNECPLRRQVCRLGAASRWGKCPGRSSGRFMIRELTKSALSFSWALSLLGAEQTLNLFRPGQRNRDNFAPLAQAAAGQLDESMRGLYRTGDNMQRGMVDMAFSLLNPAAWLNPGTWTSVTNAANAGGTGGNGGAARGVASMMNPMNWMNPANFMRTMTDRAPQTPSSSPHSGQPATPPAGSVPVTNASAAAGWGPMPSDS